MNHKQRNNASFLTTIITTTMLTTSSSSSSLPPPLPPKSIADCIASDVWAEVVLQMLDARDLIALQPPATSFPPGAAIFVAKRVLSPVEVERLTALVRVDLLEEKIMVDKSSPMWLLRKVALLTSLVNLCVPLTVWLKNGEIHRDDDLPAIQCLDGTKMWAQHGHVHRDGDRPAIMCGGTWIWCRLGIRHRDGDLPAVMRQMGKDGKQDWGGSREWWVMGSRHRDGDKPAVEEPWMRRNRWYRHGKLCYETFF